MALTRSQVNFNTRIRQDVLKRKKKIRDKKAGVNNRPFRTGDGRPVDQATGLPIADTTPRFNKFGVQVGAGSLQDTSSAPPTTTPTTPTIVPPSRTQEGGQVAQPAGAKKNKTQLEILQDQVAQLTQEKNANSDKRAAEKKAADINRGKAGIPVGQTSVTADNPFQVDVSGLDQNSQNIIQGFKDQVELQKQLGQNDQQAASKAIEDLRRTSALSKLRGDTISGMSAQDAIAAEEQRLGHSLTATEIAAFAAQEGIDVSQETKDRINLERNNSIDNLKIERNNVQAWGTFTLDQISRTFDRRITDREQHNIQQDARLRRMANIFGSANVSTANAAIMQSKEKGVRALEDLSSEFAGRLDVASAKAFGAIKTITNNINLIENQKSIAIENKYIELQDSIQSFIDQGITDSELLREKTAAKRKEYFDSYRSINDVAIGLINAQNKSAQLIRDESNKKLSKNELIFDKAISDLRSQLQSAGIPISFKFGEVIGEGLRRINTGENSQSVISDVFRAINNNPNVRTIMGNQLLKQTTTGGGDKSVGGGDSARGQALLEASFNGSLFGKGKQKEPISIFTLDSFRNLDKQSKLDIVSFAVDQGVLSIEEARIIAEQRASIIAGRSAGPLNQNKGTSTPITLNKPSKPVAPKKTSGKTSVSGLSSNELNKFLGDLGSQ